MKNGSCTEGNKRAAVYHKAARMLERRALRDADLEYSCVALAKSAGRLAEWDFDDGCVPSITAYVETFAFSAGELQDLIEECPWEERLDLRVTLLCMMAAMVEAGDA